MKRDLTSKRIGEIIKNNTKLLEIGDIKLGDIVYCKMICEDVILLEKPKERFFVEYNKLKKFEEFPPFPGDIVYQTFDGNVSKCGIADIVKISEGSYFADVNVHVKNKEGHNQAEFIEYLARSYGFRVEKNQRRNQFILRIFGDSRKAVIDFVSLYDSTIW